MKTRMDEKADPPPRDAVTLSHWLNQVTELARLAREPKRMDTGVSPRPPGTPPPAVLVQIPADPCERHTPPVRQREPHLCKHPDGLIAKSWTDALVRTRRLTRDHVEVIRNQDTPREFRSLAQAFKVFELPKKLLTDLRKRIKNEYARFINGESDSEFVAIEYEQDVFVFRIVKREK